MEKNIEFNALPVYNDRYIKTKIRAYGDKICTNFLGLKVPEDAVEGESFTAISLDSLLIYDKELILVKVMTVKNLWFDTIGFLIMGSNFKIMFVMAVMYWRYCVLILVILLLSLLKELIIVALFIILANLKPIFCYKILCLVIVRIYKRCMSKKSILKIELTTIILTKAKKLETKNILFDDKNYIDLVICFTSYVPSKSIKMWNLYYHELIGKI